MKFFKFVSIAFIFLTMILPIYSQENSVLPKRTPEQEAAKQTEKIQQELNLNQVQANHIYEINLRYARERQISNKRSEALERMKNKNAEIKQVLSPEQNDRLNSKRYERTYLETNTLKRNLPDNSATFRPSTNFRTNQSKRVPDSKETRIKNNLRPVNPDYHPGTQPEQNKRRNSTNALPSNQFQHKTYTPGTSSGNSHNATRRNESVTAPRNSSTARPSRPAYTPVKPNRK